MPKARPIPAADPAAPLRMNASLPVMLRLEEVLRFDRAVRDPANVEEIHDMRIAVKRLRYTLEVFSGAIVGADVYLKTMRSLQELLGAIHDADVLVPLLEEESQTSGHGSGIQALHAHALAERDRLYEEFLKEWDAALDGGITGRLWEAALAASSEDTGPEMDGGVRWPPKRTRRIHKAIAMLRLVPQVAGSATPARLQEMESAMARLQAALIGPDADEKDIRRAVRRLGKLLSPDGA